MDKFHFNHALPDYRQLDLAYLSLNQLSIFSSFPSTPQSIGTTP